MDRKELRKDMRGRRDAIALRKRLGWSARAVELLRGTQEYSHADSIFVFLSFGSELDTQGIVEGALLEGKKVYVPVVAGKEMIGARIKMEHYKSRYSEPLWSENRYGIAEPNDYSQSIASAREVALVVAPGLLFDMRGYRIGYGGGYYDRFLKERGACFTAGLCFAMQLASKLPDEPHDQQVDAVVTEKNVYTIE